MDVDVGSNVYRNTDGMIEIEGVPQIEVALKPIKIGRASCRERVCLAV